MSRDPEEHRPVPGRKDKKRWCGGHVGRPHVTGWQHDAHGMTALACVNCGKKTKRCLGLSWWPCVCGLHKKGASRVA